ncbi:hypothetical protein L2E82_07990 [Cichorium intybus]|uniref:Uncharacterized protein n=1 Tax=Cichorium intybus TaxID=13427 RepID=A0ACB9G5C1_CICIN|nr:hypothetical protein L2E82_07990 [Cichorium intybus]
MNRIDETIDVIINNQHNLIRIFEVQNDIEGLKVNERKENSIADEDKDNDSNSDEDDISNFEDDEDQYSSEEEASEKFSDGEQVGSTFKTDTVIQETIIQDEDFEATHGVEKWKSQASMQKTDEDHQNNQSDLIKQGEKDSDPIDQTKELSTGSPIPTSPLTKLNSFNDTDPNVNLAAQTKTDEINNTLEICSDTLRLLLSKSTPIKEKLEFLEKKKDDNQKEDVEAPIDITETAFSQTSKRVTRSQSRRNSNKDDYQCANSNGEQKLEDSSSSVAIFTRIEEIREGCGFKDEDSNQRKSTSNENKGKKGELKRIQ